MNTSQCDGAAGRRRDIAAAGHFQKKQSSRDPVEWPFEQQCLPSAASQAHFACGPTAEALQRAMSQQHGMRPHGMGKHSPAALAVFAQLSPRAAAQLHDVYRLTSNRLAVQAARQQQQQQQQQQHSASPVSNSSSASSSGYASNASNSGSEGSRFGPALTTATTASSRNLTPQTSSASCDCSSRRSSFRVLRCGAPDPVGGPRTARTPDPAGRPLTPLARSAWDARHWRPQHSSSCLGVAPNTNGPSEQQNRRRSAEAASATAAGAAGCGRAGSAAANGGGAAAAAARSLRPRSRSHAVLALPSLLLCSPRDSGENGTHVSLAPRRPEANSHAGWSPICPAMHPHAASPVASGTAPCAACPRNARANAEADSGSESSSSSDDGRTALRRSVCCINGGRRMQQQQQQQQQQRRPVVGAGWGGEAGASSSRLTRRNGLQAPIAEPVLSETDVAALLEGLRAPGPAMTPHALPVPRH